MRDTCDLSNLSFGCGMIGRLKTLNILPVKAGDSIDIDMQGVIKMTPFRRPLQTDFKVDIVSFFVPHRHVYGSEWVELMKEGPSSAVSLPTFTTTTNNWDDFRAIPWISHVACPLWLPEGYVKIWNRYFRTDRQGLAERSNTYSIANDDRFGWLCATLPAIWNIGHDSTGYPGNDTVGSATTVSLTELAQQSAEFESQLQREWTANYYSDVMDRLGGYATIDADERPEVLGHTSKWLSGFDVYGTSADNLGEAAGRVETLVGHRIPKKLMPEHGTIWTMAVLRVPPTHELEVPVQARSINSTYEFISGDPYIQEKKEPHDLVTSECFATTTATSLGKIPYGMWWQYQPNIVDKHYQQKKGLPFFQKQPASLQEAVLYGSRDYGVEVQSEEFLHFQYALRFNTVAQRLQPSYGKSLFAGTEI